MSNNTKKSKLYINKKVCGIMWRRGIGVVDYKMKGLSKSFVVLCF